jgi:hypothetical protein
MYHSIEKNITMGGFHPMEMTPNQAANAIDAMMDEWMDKDWPEEVAERIGRLSILAYGKDDDGPCLG